MIVTEIRQQVKDSKRYSVFIDGEFAFGMSGVDVLYHHLKEGLELSREEYERILSDTVYNKAKDKAIKLLGFAARSEKELRERLLKDYNEEITDKVTAMLKHYGYINDEAYAKAYYRECSRLKKWGERRIKYELKLKGISDEAIALAAEEDDTDTAEVIAALIEKRLKGRKITSYAEYKKQADFLARRGFSYDDIKDGLSGFYITED
jgi:regulatory protein